MLGEEGSIRNPTRDILGMVIGFHPETGEDGTSPSEEAFRLSRVLASFVVDD
jgi:hypothetical protein